jgi:hypothetical protein
MRSYRLLSLGVAMLALRSFAAGQVWFTPAAPDTTDKFRARISVPGCLADGAPVVTSAGSAIDIQLTAGPCPVFSGFPPFTGPTVYEPLFAARPAGDYRLTFRLKEANGTETILAERRLVIHDAVPDVEVRPWVSPVSGGAELHVRGHDPLCLGGNCPTTGVVTIDGQPFTARYTPDELIIDAAPPHAEGAVDVTISYNGKELRSNALLYYYDPQHRPEPSVFEPVLLPVLDSRPGVFGTRWETTAVMTDGPNYYIPSSAPASVHETDGFRPLPNAGFPNGMVVYIPRRVSAQTHLSLRLREVSRNPDAYGTELPVVRDKDFLGPAITLYDVPIGLAVRSKLRIYSLDPPEGDHGNVVLTITRAGTNRIADESIVFRWTRPPCSYLDPSMLPPGVPASGRFDLNLWTNDAKAWAFVTVVDNATQSVSVATPR